ncbi:hypothetical protein ACTU6U_05430 [Microbacterium sp. A196]|uniref:hypothetical protein n=1 Tax=unclassified Microbacterium TaxID=2609290 RepID=UPI003FD50FAF
MTSDADDALSWEGDDGHPDQKSAAEAEREPVLPKGWKAVGKDSTAVEDSGSDGAIVDSEEPPALSTPMLLLAGIMGGIYLLYTIGWIIGGFRLQVGALFLIPNVMYQVGVWAAVLAPALWFTAVWLLTRHSPSWQRILWLLVGVVLLVPWPFVMTGAVGA